MKRTVFVLALGLRIACLFAWALCRPGAGSAAETAPRQARITVRLEEPATVFDPVEALGAGVDGHRKEDTEAVYSPAIIQKMLSAGLHPLAYRLRTELAIEAWHWNPKGHWSDPAGERGYWTSDPDSKEPIRFCYGYRLPRRGNTLDEANNDGYSMLDDGDPATFWKSNPYLDESFTGEPPGSHPQWVAVDFQKPVALNAIRIDWAAPFATRFEVEYANRSVADYYGVTVPGVWKRFPNGTVTSGTGGRTLIRLSERPIHATYLRIRLLESSRTPLDPASADARDRMGYAIRELEAGRIDAPGTFHDAILHKRSREQTRIYASSTDPWHRAGDLDPSVTQPGFDLVAESGLTRGRPMMIPVPVLYDTPENAAAEVAFLKSRGYPLHRVELGEEPDGQRADPRDYAALYMQVAARIRAIDPQVSLGGPSFVCVEGDEPENLGDFHRGIWIRAFMDYLRARNRLADFNFLSFEWYPFDHGNRPVPQLARASRMLRNAVGLLHRSGVPASMPLLISEYGYSAYACQPEVDLGGALLDTEIACEFLALKGSTSFLYGYEPGSLTNDWGDTWGDNMFFLFDGKGGIGTPVATYRAACLLTHEWADPEGGSHALYPASVRLPAGVRPLLAAYPVRRPDGRWAVMLINKSPDCAFTVSLDFAKGAARVPSPFAAPFEVFRFSSRQYEWKERGAEGFPARSEPASRETIRPGSGGAAVTIPPWSLTVLRSGPAPAAASPSLP